MNPKLKKYAARIVQKLAPKILSRDEFLRRNGGGHYRVLAPEVLQVIPVAKSLAEGAQAPLELNEKLIRFGSGGVYSISTKIFPKSRVLSNGGVQLDRTSIVCSGLPPQLGSQLAVLSDHLRLRSTITRRIIVAPWPHYSPNTTYGDFIVWILPRICRILEMMDPANRKEAVVAYPLLEKSFEKNLLWMLGIGPEQLVDTRSTDIRPTADGMIYCANEIDINWMDCSSHPADYTLTRKRFAINQQKVPETRRRLYLRRNPARRRAFTNEEEVCGLLRKHRFEVLELGALSSEDQINLCSEASILFGIHGADLTNMLWCPAGATIIEIFGRGFRPNFHRTMAHGLGLKYLYWAEEPYIESSFSNLNMDVTMDIQLLENYLNKIDIETNQPSAL